MRIEEIQSMETRVPETLNIIYLIKDNGNSPWYKAYEYSAYLLEFLNTDLEPSERLKPTHKQCETLGTVINVGLQFKSLQKFLPKFIIDEDNTDTNIIQIKVELPIEITIENYRSLLDAWKSSVHIKQKPTNSIQKTTNVYSQPITFSSIMRDILKFSTYNKSQEELNLFITSLKEKCADLIC